MHVALEMYGVVRTDRRILSLRSARYAKVIWDVEYPAIQARIDNFALGPLRNVIVT